MKNISTTLFVLILSIVCFSCATDDAESPSADQDLGSDARFISFMQDQSTVLDNVKDLNAFEPFFDKTHLSDADITIISSLLGYDNIAQYERHLSKQNEIIKALNEQYDLSKYTQAQLTQFSLDALNTTKTSSRGNSRTPIDVEPVETERECRENCIDERVACILDAAIVAGIRHFDCSLGNPNPVDQLNCHIRVDLIQIREIGKCVRDADDCIEDCEDH